MQKNILVVDFIQKKEVATLFLLLLIDIFTCNAIKQFKLHINIVIVNTNNISTCYGFFIPFRVGIMLTRIYCNVRSAIKTIVIVKDDFDYCRYIDVRSHFYKFYYAMIVEKKISKFKSINYINVSPC